MIATCSMKLAPNKRICFRCLESPLGIERTSDGSHMILIAEAHFFEFH